MPPRSRCIIIHVNSLFNLLTIIFRRIQVPAGYLQNGLRHGRPDAVDRDALVRRRRLVVLRAQLVGVAAAQLLVIFVPY